MTEILDDVQPARQVAALVWRTAEANEVDVLLVTSRRTRRWVLPKGWPIEGRSAAEAAAQEAFEEAGVVCAGTSDALIGTYTYGKVLKDGSVLPCMVDVFAIPLDRLLDEWPEMRQRRRRWYGLEAAASLVIEPDLQSLLLQFNRRP